MSGGVVHTVFDIGAHEGVYARWANAAFGNCAIHCFEPLPDLAAALQRDPVISEIASVHCLALGSKMGERRLSINGFSAASSFFEVSDVQRAAFPQTRKVVGYVDVPCTSLDEWCREHPRVKGPFFLKIDVQGSELDVLVGAEKTLRRTSAVTVELSMHPMYEKTASSACVWAFLEDAGFHMVEIVRELRDPQRAMLLQVDALFSRG